MSKPKSERFALVAGENNLVVRTGDALISEIQFQSTCDAVITAAFHGARNLLSEKQMFPMSGEHTAGPGRADRREASLLTFAPSEEFHSAFSTTFCVLAADKGTMIITFRKKRFASAFSGSEISLPRKMQEQIFRAAGWPQKAWSRFELSALVRDRR